MINKIASSGKLSSLCSSKVLKFSQSLPTLPGFRLGSRVSVGGRAMFWKMLPQALNPALTFLVFIYLFIYLETDSLTKPGHHQFSLASERKGSLSSFHRSMTDIYYWNQLFYVMLRDWTQVLRFAQQALSQLDQLPSPTYWNILNHMANRYCFEFSRVQRWKS